MALAALEAKIEACERAEGIESVCLEGAIADYGAAIERDQGAAAGGPHLFVIERDGLRKRAARGAVEGDEGLHGAVDEDGPDRGIDSGQNTQRLTRESPQREQVEIIVRVDEPLRRRRSAHEPDA